APARVAVPADPGTQAHQTRHARIRIHAPAHAGDQAPRADVRLQHDETAREVVISFKTRESARAWHLSSCGQVLFCAGLDVLGGVRLSRTRKHPFSGIRNVFVDVILEYRVHETIP